LNSYYAVSSDHQLSTLSGCYDNDGELDILKFLQHQEKMSDLSRAERNMTLFDKADSLNDDRTTATGSTKQSRSVKACTPCYFDDDGEIVYLKPRQTVWWHSHIQSPQDTPSFRKKFRRRFRMTLPQHNVLLNKVKASPLFVRWMGADATGKKASPIELLLLGALRYLGRGLTFDDLEECTEINEETHQQFVHVFIDWGSTDFFYQEVTSKTPKTKEQCQTHRHEFDIRGLTGAGFSTDATNVIMW